MIGTNQLLEFGFGYVVYNIVFGIDI